MVVIVVEFRTVPGKRADFLNWACENARQSLQLEEGCLDFDVCIDPSNENAVLLYEVYVDMEQFQKHLMSSHFRSFDALTQDCVVSKVVRNLELAFSRVEAK